LIAAALAVAVAALDLAHKVIDGRALHHERSFAAVLLMASVAAGLLVVVPRLRSMSVAVGAGIAAGGAVGNLVSALAWRSGVPDPLVLRDVAFNLADVFVFGGDALLLAAAALYALRNRDRLRQPI
jgi:lipoprotein signal peptidase